MSEKKTILTGIRLKRSTMKRADTLARQIGISRSALIRLLIDQAQVISILQVGDNSAGKTGKTENHEQDKDEAHLQPARRPH